MDEDGARDTRDRDPEELDDQVDELRAQLDALENSVEDRTVHREELEAELKRYVRERIRRGHARGWGPYLVLLYGTGMTIGAFYYLSGGWAILAMIIIWLSTLGLYAVMLLVGLGVNLLSAPRQAVNRVRDWRS